MTSTQLTAGAGSSPRRSALDFRPGRGKTSHETVLFACIHNAGRSQMATAWFSALANPDLARAISASTEPSAAICMRKTLSPS